MYLLNKHLGSLHGQGARLESEMWLWAVASKKDRGEDMTFSR